MRELFQNLAGILQRRDRRKLGFLFVVLIVVAVVETLGVASIMPFMALVANPQILEENEMMAAVFEFFDFDSREGFFVASGVFVIALLATANLMKAGAQWLQYRFSFGTAHSLALRLLTSYVHQPYSFFFGRNSTELGKQVLAEINVFVDRFLMPFTEICARVLILILIVALFFVVDPILAVVVVAVLGGSYAVLSFSVRKYVTRLGEARRSSRAECFATTYEVLKGIKVVKTESKESYFLGKFRDSSRVYTQARIREGLASSAPRFIVETVAFGSVAGIIVYFIAAGRDFGAIIPVMSLYVVGGYRLLPSLQKMYSSFNSIRYSMPIATELRADLAVREAGKLSLAPGGHKTDLEKDITVADVTYQYPNTDEVALKGVTLHVGKGEKVALVGHTGSGKSTLVDIIMGLLAPTSGSVRIDDMLLTAETLRDWRLMVGYVPQEVFLFDDTVRRNIAVGVTDDLIDDELIRTSAAVAKIDDFIESELPHGYDTVVGEMGIRLSGGQRQRIGLARSLYRRPSVLIFDEATSALDGITEDEVVRAIDELPHTVTMIMIAHRLTTVRSCDRIYLLEAGKIVSEGTYENLVRDSKTFREMARLTAT